jgi:hypothetical protein
LPAEFADHDNIATLVSEFTAPLPAGTPSGDGPAFNGRIAECERSAVGA